MTAQIDTTPNWQAETPILIEALAAATEVSTATVVEHLDAESKPYRPDAVAVTMFVNEYVAAG